ncbi:MAG: DUF58 domain-containing protein [Alphaproteobacteria bacterium]|nr:DUF58 domain-containing protein [Alphaproteobacteria bacterium]
MSSTVPTRPNSIRQAAAEAVAGRLPALQIAAERVAMTVLQGVHGRRRVGQGEAFWQFRRYEPGDPLIRIDWRQSAKRDHVFVRETEWEAAQSAWLWRDNSASMRWRSLPALPTKLERAELILLALVALLVRGGERVALLGHPMRPIAGRPAVTRILERLGDVQEQETGLPPEAPLPRHASVILISDFFAPLADIDRRLRALAARGVGGVLLQVVDPAEESLPFTGRTRFEGVENDGDMLVPRVESIRGDYARAFADHRAGLADITRALGWRVMLHHTDHSPQSALMALWVALARSGDGPGGFRSA